MKKLTERPFIKALQQVGKIYKVGGVVRDSLLNKESKDLDILVCGVPIDTIISLLQPLGNIDLVGKIFGVLKFQDEFFGEVDIAIPRTERLMTPLEIQNVEHLTGEKLNPHKAFILDSDPYLPIEDDLRRRDFTINSMAQDLDGNLIDPFNGMWDLLNGSVRCTNDKSFIDDPLRMLRAVQFASRFQFKIEEKTLQSIKDNSENIKGISKERILIELDKIFYKGDIVSGINILNYTGIFDLLFESQISMINLSLNISLLQHRSEFYFLLLRNQPNPEEFFLNNLKGDLDTYKKIKAISLIFKSRSLYPDNPIHYKSILIESYKIDSIIKTCKLLPANYDRLQAEMNRTNQPWHRSELAVNGNDLKVLGLSGKAVGDLLENIHINILDNKLNNLKDDIISWIKSNI